MKAGEWKGGIGAPCLVRKLWYRKNNWNMLGQLTMTGGSWWMALGCFIKRDREEEEEDDEESCSMLRRTLKCLELNWGNCKTPIGCLWVKIRGGSYSRHLLSNLDDKPNKVIIGSLKQVSGQQNLVLMVISTTQKNHVIHQVPGMHRALLPHTRVRCANEEWVTTGFPTHKPKKPALYYVYSWRPWLQWSLCCGIWYPAEHTEGEN